MNQLAEYREIIDKIYTELSIYSITKEIIMADSFSSISMM